MTWFGVKSAQFKAGFRDLRWGDPQAPGMAVLKKDGEEALYMRGNDSLRMGDGRLAGITLPSVTPKAVSAPAIAAILERVRGQ